MLLCQSPEEDFGYSGAKNNAMGILHLGNFADVLYFQVIMSAWRKRQPGGSSYLVCIGVVDLVQGKHRGEFLVNEGIDNDFYCFIGPLFQRLFDASLVETPRNCLRGTSVTSELFL